MKRKFFCMIFTFVFLTTALTISVNAGIALDYWYSDSSKIHFWNNSSLSVYANPYLSGITQADLESYITLSFSKWNSAIGISKSFTTNQSSADIEVLGLDRTTATNAGVPGNAAAIGFINDSDKTLFTTGTYGGATKNIYETDGVGHLYYVWDSTSEGFETSTWQKLFVHEMGHIFGYVGHYSSGAVMKPNLANITTTTPSTNEINHLGQVY